MLSAVETQSTLQVHAADPTNPVTRAVPILNLSRRIPELDGYRGLAVMLGLFFHYIRFAMVARPPQLLGYVYTLTPLSWSGMEIFFLLSGFLIAGILLDAKDSPRYFSTYYIRRSCRILPVYFGFLALVAASYYFIYRSAGTPLNWLYAGRMPWYSYFTFTQNFWNAKLNAPGPPILSVTWSIAVEEQFYLLLPLIVRFVKRSALPYVFLTGIVMAPISRAVIVLFFREHLRATYVLLPCRMDALLIGALCAYALREPRAREWLVSHRRQMWIVFFALIAGMPPLNNSGIPFTWLWLTVGIGWMSTFYAVVLLLALTGPTCIFSRVMRWPWFTNLGVLAYSLYLFHLGIYCFCMWYLRHHGWVLANWKDFGVTLLATAITITFCKLSWKYFEKPIVRWSHRFQY